MSSDLDCQIERLKKGILLTEPEVRSLVERAKEIGDNCIFVHTDVTSPEQVANNPYSLAACHHLKRT